VSENDSGTLWKPNPSDSEEVNWALSTAAALLGRGERAEAIKWVRRAAEQASDDGADDRSIELARVVGELATIVASAPPPPPAAAPAPPPEAPAPPPAAAAAPPPEAPAPPPPPAAPAPPAHDHAAPSKPPAAVPADLAELQRKAPPLPGARASAPPPIPALPSAPAANVVAALAELSGFSPPSEVATQPPPEVAVDEPPVVAKHEPPAQPAQTVSAATDPHPVHVSQAVKVIVAPLSGPAARVTLAEPGARIPAGGFEAMLVGLSPDADIAAIFVKK
jgi:hypothetical protein